MAVNYEEKSFTEQALECCDPSKSHFGGIPPMGGVVVKWFTYGYRTKHSLSTKTSNIGGVD